MSFKLIRRTRKIACICQDRALRDHLLVVRGVSGRPVSVVIVSEVEVIPLIFGD